MTKPDPESRPESHPEASPFVPPIAPVPPSKVRPIDRIAFSTALPAAIAAALSAVSSRALGGGFDWTAMLIAASGAFVVYGLDRLRDTRRDRRTSPLRTRFIEAHAARLRFAIVGIGAILLLALATSDLLVSGLCLFVGSLGLLHRRLKELAALKSLYVSAAWVAICAGIPAVNAGFDARFAWLAGVLFPAFLANLVASNLRDDESQLGRGRPKAALWTARGLAATGVVVAWLSPTALVPLFWVPLAEAVALAFFRPSEHYGHLAVDGALLVGAILALVHLALA